MVYSFGNLKLCVLLGKSLLLRVMVSAFSQFYDIDSILRHMFSLYTWSILNGTCPHNPSHLKICYPVGISVRGSLGSVSLLKELCHLMLALSAKPHMPCSVCSFSFVFQAQGVSPQFQQHLVPITYCLCFTITASNVYGTIHVNTVFLLLAAFVMMFYHIYKNVTNIPVKGDITFICPYFFYFYPKEAWNMEGSKKKQIDLLCIFSFLVCWFLQMIIEALDDVGPAKWKVHISTWV